MKPQKSPPLRGAIVALAPQNIIGINGNLPWHYRADLQRFKKRTLNSVVIMGRITWESIGRKPLPTRRNIVISRSPVPDAEHYTSVKTAIDAYPHRRIWIIGGAQIYRAALPYLNLLDVTYVPDTLSTADGENVAKFPKIEPTQWRKGRKRAVPGDNRLSYVLYHRIAAY